MRFGNVFKVCLWAVVLGAVAAGCAMEPEPSTGQVAEPIIHGTDDNGRDPSVVLLTGDLPRGIYLCTASIITPRIALTAGHCVDVPGATNVHVLFLESWDLESGDTTGVIPPTRLNVVGRWLDPDFDENQLLQAGGGHDVALLLLSDAVPSSIVPIPIYRSRLTRDFFANTDRLVGFGDRQDDQPDLFKRQFATVTVTSLTNQQFTFPNQTSSFCQGDSGGPHMFMVNGVETIAGVTSTGAGACLGKSNVQRLDVDLQLVLDYIAAHDPQSSDNCGADGICGWNCPAIDPDCPCVLDGRCDVACPTLDIDPDCPATCDHDGVCQRTGCPRPDPDCGNSSFGDTCTTNQNCASDLCVVDGSGHVCSQMCDASGGCPAGFTCKSSTKVCNADTGGGGGCSIGSTGAGSGLLGGLAGLGIILLLRSRQHRRPARARG
jgi:hypothetical protein